ncbi:hypothetical protein [Paenibacillus planticolens]|uniref:hypothetical protein n=1 Tax=Paenibacillus planticolens TaxID=2654976 RepID=UPI001490B81A|nr:hypothetical protein [Paenibacillus planticolens]
MMIEAEVEVVDDYVNLFISNEKVHENKLSEIYYWIHALVLLIRDGSFFILTCPWRKSNNSQFIY